MGCSAVDAPGVETEGAAERGLLRGCSWMSAYDTLVLEGVPGISRIRDQSAGWCTAGIDEEMPEGRPDEIPEETGNC